MTEVYILLHTKNGRKKKEKRGGVNIRTNNASRIELLAGTLLVKSLSLNEGIVDRSTAVYESIETADIVEIQCDRHETEKLRGAESDLLRPIPTCLERLDVYHNKEWLTEGSTLRPDDTVFVKIRKHQSELPGVLRYRGPLPDLPGIYFGVELTENRGEGTCDGSYQKVRYFSAPPHSGVFCPLHKIRKRRQGWQVKESSPAGQASSVQPEMASPDDQLRIGDRVMWPSDSGNEYGTVRWIGILPEDVSRETTVGVEFDKPIGTGTGKYRDHRLFYTKQGHASLVPLMGLIRVDSQDELAEPPPTPGLDALDTYIPSQTLSQEYIRQQEELLRNFQPNPAPNSAPLLPDRAPISQPYSSETQRHAPHLDIRTGGCSRATPDAASDQTVRGVGLEGHVGGAKGTVPVEESAGVEQQMQALGLRDNVGEEGGVNPLYLISKYPDEASEQVLRDMKQSSSGSQVSVDPDLTVGSMVEVLGKPPRYGVIRWVGLNDAGKVTAGLEMEEEISAGTDGTFRGVRHFTCAARKALFVPLNKCRKDKRFHSERSSQEEFGTLETPDITGDISPPEVTAPEELSAVCGKNKGIQGHHNSCYLDASLFSMFYFSTVFDFIFNKPPRPGASPDHQLVQRVLKEGIVNPLRSYHYVRADKVLRLRELLDKLGTIPGMMGEEKDPEEFLSALLSQIMEADPLLHLSSGEHTYFYQLFIEKDEKLLLPTTQILVELSFLQGNVKLAEVPSCLILQMPRFGKDYKMYRRIIPSLELDITDILETGIRECIVCGALARYECKDCYSQHGQGLNTTAFCEQCIIKSHQHKKRQGHNPRKLLVPPEFLSRYEAMRLEAAGGQIGGQNGEVCGQLDVALPREKMELFAVVCIQTSHYVSFVRCGLGRDAPWVFFDSMADRQGEQGGYNIPQVQHVPEFSQWLSENNFQHINNMTDDRQLPEHMRRLLCDAYMVMYQSPSVMMFR